MDNHELNIAGLKVTAVAGAASAAYLSLNDWVAIFTILFLLLQIILLIPKYVRWIRGKKVEE